ncbi:hypothetical protein [Cedecea neteri]|uniref:hypothetical protein n=1 Tax=Cedecea neteri TaxID=158822 RepID=UPI0028A109E5|nr:hypothetical protein [Cedecea neteri]
MELIARYQPEFVLRHAAIGEACTCLACQNAPGGWPRASVNLPDQIRESLDSGCESVARELLLNPQAFVLHESRRETQAAGELNVWDSTLNQQCINLAVHTALSLEASLYALGVLLSKAQQYLAEGNCDPERLVSMGEQLAQLAEHGVLAQQLALLPPIEDHCLTVLKAMGTMRLDLNLPIAEKMSLRLKLSEMSLMPAGRLSERLLELRTSLQHCEWLTAQPHILRNILIYRLYHDVFPGAGCKNYGAAMFTLAQDFFQLKMLIAMAMGEEVSLAEDKLTTLFSAWERWRKANPTSAREAFSADYSLLCGLSLL